jgi:hypothetical protein
MLNQLVNDFFIFLLPFIAGLLAAISMLPWSKMRTTIIQMAAALALFAIALFVGPMFISADVLMNAPTQQLLTALASGLAIFFLILQPMRRYMHETRVRG